MSGSIVTLEGELTIYRAGELKPLLLHALAEAGDGLLRLDLSAVTEIDSAGLQLLMLTRIAGMTSGRHVQLLDPSPEVDELMALLGVDGLFDVVATSARSAAAAA